MNPILVDYKNYLIQIKQLSEGTAKGYVSDMKLFFEFHANYKTVTRPKILEYLTRLSADSSPATIMKKTSALQSFWKFLVDNELVDKDITVGLPRPKIKAKLVVAPEEDEVETIIADLREKGDDVLAMAVIMGSQIGLRAEEAITICLENINFETGVAILYDTKTAQSAQVAISKHTLEEIKAHCEKYGITEGTILRNKSGNPFGIRHFMKLVQDNVPWNYHSFRKACATKLANISIHVAQQQLRHSSIQTTTRYLAPSAEKNAQFMNNIF